MNKTEFLRFGEELKHNLDGVDSVIGLAFVGSAADVERADEWSDHDFFVFTTDGNAEALRQNLEWLPDYDHIAFWIRETEHGLKVIYQSGHVLEFAVFEPAWEVSGVNAYEVVLDKAQIEQRMKDAQTRSVPRPVDVDRECSLLLAHLLIGIGRYRRGELIAANQFITSFCVGSVIKLADVLCAASPGSQDSVDNQNPLRRFEQRHPQLARDLDRIQRMDLETNGQELLRLADQHFGPHLSEQQVEQMTVVKTRLGW